MLAESVRQSVGALLRKEKFGAFQLDDAACAGNRFLEPIRPLQRKELICRSPHDQGRRVQFPQQRFDFGCWTTIARSDQPALQIASRLLRAKEARRVRMRRQNLDVTTRGPREVARVALKRGHGLPARH